MKEERRLVWRVLRNWKEIADSGRFPCRDEINAWMRGEDGANCLLIAVGWSIELSHFVVVGVNLAVALCPTDTLAGTLLSRVRQVISSRRGLMIEGVATLRGEGIRYRAVLLPLSEDGATIDHMDELSLAAHQRGPDDAGQFPLLTDGPAGTLATSIAAGSDFNSHPVA
jgi:hypothetical protein